LNAYGLQGGDPTANGSFLFDLSSCVNRYGPPAKVNELLKNFDNRVLRSHPYTAVEDLKRVYADQFPESLPEQFLAGRGTTEFIFRIPLAMQQRRIRVIHPYYTDFIRVLDGANHPYELMHATSEDKLLESIADSLKEGLVVLFSNPSNPTGSYLSRGKLHELLALSESYRGVLLIDESYADFVEGRDSSMIGCPFENVVIFQSPSKFFGIASTRTGILWSRSPVLLSAFKVPDPTWTISGLDVAIAEAAMRDLNFAIESRHAIKKDVNRLQKMIFELFHIEPLIESSTNFLFFGEETTCLLASQFEKVGIRVRRFGLGHGFRKEACRISAPRIDEYNKIALLLSHRTSYINN